MGMPMLPPPAGGLFLMIEQTITVGNIIEVVLIVGGGIAVFVTLRATVVNLKEQVEGVQAELKKLADVITRMAVTDVRLTNLETDVRELRHGRGFVREAIDGEWPKAGR